MCFLRLAILFSFLSGHAIADQTPFYANSQYNDAQYGDYVTQTFKSNPQITAVPIINFMKPFTNCDDGSYLMIAPRGNVAEATPMVLDVTGSPVWVATQSYGQVYNLQVQIYKDEPFLTFWAGNDAVGGHGIGEYFMLDQQYRERYRIEAANRLGADLHVFTITAEGTALISIYDKKAADIDSVVGHHRRGWIWDSIFQEIDLETGEAVFEWHASDHIDVSKSYTSINAAEEYDPWDVYHLNSVEKDDLGNYLISARYLRALLYIDGKTGDVLWQLGGKDNAFIDLSQGEATKFLGQHDAHFLYKDGKKYITFFDNKADWDHQMDEQSKGTRIEINLDSMTARLDAAMYDPTTNILSSSQGSYQTLPNGHVVLGYGFNGAMAEFSEDGELLCDAYFQPSSTFGSGNVQSYRNLRFNWTGYPSTAPDFALDGRVLYMSWNGATEVVTWLLLGSDTDERELSSVKTLRSRAVQDVLVLDKMGFETRHEIPFNEALRRFVRVVALDKEGRALGTSQIVDIGYLATAEPKTSQHGEAIEAVDDPESSESDQTDRVSRLGDSQILVAFGVLAGLSGVLVLVLAFGKKKILCPWHATGSILDLEKAPALVQHPASRLAVFLRQVRQTLPGLRARDDFTDTSAREGLLGDRGYSQAVIQRPIASIGVVEPRM
ncbi:Putative arylsulfotransferase [Septoria linicola]|uniref:Arylsulfotransferase n=1 Tax=Septoria linicola TaxID=215465 RepID=A0A9Q9EKQ4_9PEZI|nr:Putative arylsulfotransferase [Septoria linicola]